MLNDFIYQVAIVTSSPEKFTKYLIDRGIHHYSVYDENNLLKEQNAELKAQLVNNQFLKTENEMLKEALKLSSNKSIEQDVSVIAKVVIDQESPYLKSFLLNKGTSDGVKKGMTVFSDKYLIGTIVEANYLTSRVLLINDLNSKIPVIIQDSNVNAILSGQGVKRRMVLDYLPEQYQLEPGRNIYTSGKDGILAAGIAVGETYYNEKDKIVEVRTLADLDQTLFVQITNGQLR